MKKLLSVLVIIMLCLALSVNFVYAEHANLKATLTADGNNTTVTAGESVTLLVNVSNFTSGEPGISSIYGVLDYDTSIFEEITNDNLSTTFEPQNGWGSLMYNSVNKAFTLLTGSFKAEDHTFAKITLKVKETATAQSTTVSIKNWDMSDGAVDMAPADSSITLRVQAKATPSPSPSPSPSAKPTATPKVTPTPSTMPKTGIEGFDAISQYALPIIVAVAAVAIFAYVRYNKMDK